jgi:hypothetical protein
MKAGGLRVPKRWQLVRETLLLPKKHLLMPEIHLYLWRCIKKVIKLNFQPDSADHQFPGPTA